LETNTSKRIAGLGPAWAVALLATGALAADSSPKTTPAEVAAWQEKGEAFFFVDTRPVTQFERKHARGAVSIPAFAVAAKPLPRGARIVVYDDGAGSSEAERAVAALRATGHSDLYLLEGGLTAWEAQGYPIVAPAGSSAVPFVETIGADELLKLIDDRTRVAIFDLSPAAAYKKGHVPGAISVPTPALLDQAVGRLQPADLIVLYDDGSGDVRQRAEALRRRGLRAVKYLPGGMPAWRAKKLREQG